MKKTIYLPKFNLSKTYSFISIKQNFILLVMTCFMSCFSQTGQNLDVVVNDKNEAEINQLLDSLQNESFDSIFSSLNKIKSFQPLSDRVFEADVKSEQEFLKAFFNLKEKTLKRNTKHSNSGYLNTLVKENDIPFNYEVSRRFPVYDLTFPINWGASPYRNNTWELYLLNFDWLDKWYKVNESLNLSKEDQGNNILLAMYAIYDFYSQEFKYPSDLKFVWYDHAISRRLERVIQCTEQYIDAFDVLDVDLLNAASYIIISHTYALASAEFYPRIPHNHGFMMDNALLLSASTLPFRERDKLLTICMARIRLQLLKSVTPNGIHMEHSPGYQTFYVFLINDVIENLIKLKLDVPKYLIDIQKALISSCTYFIQPNLTHIQFGDTKGGTKPIDDFKVQLDRFKRLMNDSNGFQELDYVLSKGSIGTTPKNTDIVYKDGGYAIFRDGWYDTMNFENQIMAAFKANNFSWTHYHRDDTTFSIFGYGREIVVDAGHYNFNRKDSLTFYQYSAYAHNVLLIDDENFRPSKKNFGRSKIIDYEIGDSTSWVKASHPHYKGFKIKNQTRTFIFKKPNKFVVTDNLDSKNQHEYKQIIHFHPDYIVMKQLDAYSCLISTKKTNDPEVIVRSDNPCTFNVSRGILNKDKIQGWYFPDANVVNDCIALEVIFKDQSPGTKTFTTEIEIIAPTKLN